MSVASRRVFRRSEEIAPAADRQQADRYVLDDVAREPRRAPQRAAQSVCLSRGVRNPDRFNRDGDGNSSEFRRPACEMRW